MKLPYANIDHYYRTSYIAESPCRKNTNEYQTTLYQSRSQFHKHIKELILQKHNSSYTQTHLRALHYTTLHFSLRVHLRFNPLNAELNAICYFLALLAHHFLHVSSARVKSLTLRLLMSYIYIWSTYS